LTLAAKGRTPRRIVAGEMSLDRSESASPLGSTQHSFRVRRHSARTSDWPCGFVDKHSATKLLRQIPCIGPIRAALLIALIQTPYRFRTKRKLWAYSGLALETHGSAKYRYLEGQLRRSKKPVALRGLNKNHKHDLKSIFKSAATKGSGSAGPLHDFYEALLAKGMEPSMARLTLARKIAAITLMVWKKGVLSARLRSSEAGRATQKQ